MSAKGQFLANALLNYVFANGPTDLLTNYLYLSLHTAGTPVGAANEVSAGGYTRQIVARDPAWFPYTSTGTITLATFVLWGPATANWGTITSVAVWDAFSGGNLLYSGDLPASQTINTNSYLYIAAGQLSFTEI